MKKMALAAFFLVAFIGSAHAHTGALNLYSDPNGAAADCDLPIGLFATDSIYLYYVRGSGFDLGNAIEFGCVLSDPDASFTPSPRWRTGYLGALYSSGTDGDLAGGVSVNWTACIGGGQSIVYLAKIYVFYGGFDASPTFTARITEDPGVGYPLVLRCDPPNNTEQQVLGGTFIFSPTPNICNVGVQSKSWGAIKSLYSK